MRRIPLRHLLAILALSASPVAASPVGELVDLDDDGDDARIDHDLIDAEDAAAVIGLNLARPLAKMRPIEATQVATTWAVSSDPIRRAAIVYALQHVSPLGSHWILDHLSHDPDPIVREALTCAKSR